MPDELSSELQPAPPRELVKFIETSLWHIPTCKRNFQITSRVFVTDPNDWPVARQIHSCVVSKFGWIADVRIDT